MTNIDEKRFLLFAHYRSGSNTLLKILSLFKGGCVTGEPFNPNFFKFKWNASHPRFNNQPTTTSELDVALSCIYSNGNGFKHISGQIDKELNLHLLSQPIKIIYLSRENRLQTAVSHYIALSQNAWTNNKKSFNQEGIPALDLNRIQSYMIDSQADNSLYLDYIRQHAMHVFEITYETLYTNKTSLEKKLDVITKLSRFLGFDIASNQLGRVTTLLKPKDELTVRGHELYRLVENIDEIESELGNDQNGHVFSD